MSGVTFPLFELLPEADRKLEMSKLKIERYPSGRVIYERGGDCLDAFFILEGRVRVDSCTAEGDTVFFHYRRPGTMIGWWASVSGRAQPVTATAADDVVLGRLLQKEFMDLVLGRRELSEWMLRFATTSLLNEANRIRYMTILSAPKRVAAGLVEYANDSETTVIEVPERVELASRLGMTRETLSRELSKLQKQGVIAFEGEKIRILDMKQLTEAIW
jgi:CRP/FNR family transcriptional regulator